MLIAGTRTTGTVFFSALSEAVSPSSGRGFPGADESGQFVSGAGGEDLDVGVGVGVANGHDVELSCVGQRADPEGNVPHEVQQREHVEQLRAGEVQRRGRAW